MTSSSNAKRPAGLTRLTWLAIALFVAFVLASSSASNRHERVLYGAGFMGVSLMCAGGVWWLHGKEVIRSRTFVWRLRRYTGPDAVRFGYAMLAGGIAFGLLGMWVLGIWFVEW